MSGLPSRLETVTKKQFITIPQAVAALANMERELATTQFSFPNGHDTFTQRHLFLQTQQLAEELTNGALLAWINDMATMGQPRLAQIGGELMQVEGDTGWWDVSLWMPILGTTGDSGLSQPNLQKPASWVCQLWSRRLAS
ncbi:MAG: hypothetical protein USCAAHI_01518 [Beijerinckiaceae bacterium]|nr:MAG: hypothetical protein USCAAHI_01518 [Beijerinckiaceae bacterium]